MPKIFIPELDFNDTSKGVFKGLEAVVYRLNTDITAGGGSGDDPLGSGGSEWECSDDTENEYFLGASNTSLLTVDDTENGVFEFQQTGYFLLLFAFDISNAVEADRTNSFAIFMTDSGALHGGAFSRITFANTSLLDSSPDSSYASVNCFAVIKTTGTATDNRFYIDWNAQSASTDCRGSGDFNRTSVVCVKLADL